MDDWLTAARDRIAAATGVEASGLELGDEEAALLLDLARVAAHESGDRRNAPLACYLVGLAAARSPAPGLEALVREASGAGD